MTIVRFREAKLLDLRFLHDVNAEDARKAWRVGFEQNCQPPCYLDPHDLKRFLAVVTPGRKGDQAKLLITSMGVVVTSNGQLMGNIIGLHFAEIILTTFIGRAPPTPRLKRELLDNQK